MLRRKHNENNFSFHLSIAMLPINSLIVKTSNFYCLFKDFFFTSKNKQTNMTSSTPRWFPSKIEIGNSIPLPSSQRVSIFRLLKNNQFPRQCPWNFPIYNCHLFLNGTCRIKKPAPFLFFFSPLPFRLQIWVRPTSRQLLSTVESKIFTLMMNLEQPLIAIGWLIVGLGTKKRSLRSL